MKLTILSLLILVACSKNPGSSKSTPVRLDPITEQPAQEIVDPLDTGDQQQQTDGDFELERTYNGANVVLNYNSRSNLGLIRIKGKDAEKLHKHMALSTIMLQSEHVKSELESKVGKHVMCRQDACWVYIDYKNGDVKESPRVSEPAKAKRVILTYRGDNLELHFLNTAGKFFVTGMDAKALYSVMAVPEIPMGGKGAVQSKKTGNGVTCIRAVTEALVDNDTYKCEVKFNHRTGALKD